jgi:hypothetical protein
LLSARGGQPSKSKAMVTMRTPQKGGHYSS